MSGKNTRVTILGDLIKELIERNADETAFTITEIAQLVVGGNRMSKLAERWVFDILPRVRQRLERVYGMTFIPVTEYYFEHWYGDAPPSTMDEARRCVAGVNGEGRTFGIRKIWIGHKDDAMAFVWLEQGFKSGANKWRKVADRLLAGHEYGEVSSKAASKMLASYDKLLPQNVTLFRKLLPKHATLR